MAIKGITLTKGLIKLIIEYDIKQLTLKQLRGLDTFNSFNFNKLRKSEIELIINAFKLITSKTDILSNVSDDQVFYLNLDIGVCEFDLITILSYNDKRIVFNIEVKNTDDNEKISNQIKSRVYENIPMSFIDMPRISLGFNDGFVKGIYVDDETKEIYDNLNAINLKFETETDPKKIIDLTNLLKPIHELLKKAENNDLKYHSDTKHTFNSIKKHIEEGKKVIIINAKAGYGKTVLAFKLYFRLNNVHLLIMNQKFYEALKMQKYYYKSNKILYGTKELLRNTNGQIVVIDEAQRLKENILTDIIDKSSHVIWIGDFNQAIHTSTNITNINDFKNYLNDKDINYQIISLRESKRYDKSVDRAVNYLLHKHVSEKSLLNLSNYEIKLYYNEKQFISSLEDTQGKLFTTNNIGFDNNISEIEINNIKFKKVERLDYGFPIKKTFSKTFGYTMNALSFDVNDNFVFLKDVTVDKKLSTIIPIKLTNSSIEAKKRYVKELYTLFTRGKKSLHILITNLDAYLHLNKKLKKINQQIIKK